jgi:hypothetical protein
MLRQFHCLGHRNDEGVSASQTSYGLPVNHGEGAWCGGIKSAPHAEGPGLNPQRVYYLHSTFGHSKTLHATDQWPGHNDATCNAP